MMCAQRVSTHTQTQNKSLRDGYDDDNHDVYYTECILGDNENLINTLVECNTHEIESYKYYGCRMVCNKMGLHLQ